MVHLVTPQRKKKPQIFLSVVFRTFFSFSCANFWCFGFTSKASKTAFHNHSKKQRKHGSCNLIAFPSETAGRVVNKKTYTHLGFFCDPRLPFFEFWLLSEAEVCVCLFCVCIAVFYCELLSTEDE